MENNNTICELVRTQKDIYTSGNTALSKYVNFSQWENINKIEAYNYSQHITGPTDSMGRDKPFFNIVTAAVNIWYRATDIDRKNIKIKASKQGQTLMAFLYTIHLQEWMRRVNFGAFLNKWGRTLAIYGSAVVQFVEQEGELIPSVLPWGNLITDTVNFHKGPVIKKLELTPSELRANPLYDQQMVDDLVSTTSERRDLQGMNIDTKSDFIELYEVHGMLPKSFLTGNEEDSKIYTQQMQVISYVASKEKGKYDDYVLYKGKEKKNPCMITHLIEEDGRTQAIGAIESLFEAQWMMNHTAKEIKDQLDLASKLIFQTADGSFVGRNALMDIQNGDILIHEANMPLTQINNNSHDITSLQSFANQWNALAKEQSATPDAIRGTSPSSGTAYRLQQLVTTEAHSLFEQMTENKCLDVEVMMREYIMPWLATKMDTVEEIGGTLTSEQITKIDSMFLPAEVTRRVNQKVIDDVLSTTADSPIENLPTPESQAQDMMDVTAQLQQKLVEQGDQRFISPSDIDGVTWKKALKDFQGTAVVDPSKEDEDSDAVLTTLSTLLQTIANPATAGVIQTPRGKFIFNKILEISAGVSPIELQELDSASNSMNTPQPTNAPIQPPQPSPTGGV